MVYKYLCLKFNATTLKAVKVNCNKNGNMRKSYKNMCK